MPPQVSRLDGSSVSYTAPSHGGSNVRYKWQFGDGTPETAFSSSPSVTHAYSGPGIYFVTLTVTDDVVASPLVQQFVQTIHLPLTANAARWSANTGCCKRFFHIHTSAKTPAAARNSMAVLNHSRGMLAW